MLPKNSNRNNAPSFTLSKDSTVLSNVPEITSFGNLNYRLHLVFIVFNQE